VETFDRIGEIAVVLCAGMGVLYLTQSIYLALILASGIVISLSLMKGVKLEELGLTKKGIWPAIKIQLPFVLVGIVGLLVFAFVNEKTIAIPDPSFALYWLVSVPLQEFLFRGYGQSLFRNKLAPLTNVFLISVVFALSHAVLEASIAMILVATTFVAGFAWGLAYERERNIIGPIISHIVLGTLIFMIIA
jgi:membrane protease YdiL (CAAX protease family)